jgi:alkylation response protein AidB-like acyl-CoA dehydrogenase
MDFNDNKEEAEYRAKVRAFLDANAPLKQVDRPEISKRLTASELIAAAKEWQARKADNGFACITWPKEWGGQGGSQIQNVVFSQEEEHYDLPVGVFQVGLGMCVPTVIALGQRCAARKSGASSFPSPLRAPT